MNVLFLDAYYEPESTAYTHLERDLILGLINHGHKIKIICPVPTRGITDDIRKLYRKKCYELQYDGYVDVTRFWAPKEGKNPILRAFRYFWCNFRTYQIACKKKGIDVVFSNSTPPTQGLVAAIISNKLSKKNKKKVPFIYSLQDIFPDSMVNAGMTKYNSFLWKIGRKLEDFTYNHAKRIIVIGKGFEKNIIEKGVDKSKISVITNWIDLDDVVPVSKCDNVLYKDLRIDENKFTVLYAGNFGSLQGADIIVNAARQLKDFKDIQFVVFGGGPLFENAVEMANGLVNIHMNKLMPLNRISEVYSMGDVAIITCKKGTGKAGMPSKTWSIMACNTPVIASFDIESDLADIIKESNAGECIEPENVDSLCEAIIRMYNKKNRTLNLRSYVKDYASKENCVMKFVEEFEKVGDIL